MKIKNLFRFKPTNELWIVLLTWVLIIAVFTLSFQVITTQRVAGQFITFGIVGIALLGVSVPASWTVFIKKRTLASIGIKKDKLLISIVLCLAFSAAQYAMTLGTITLPPPRELIPLLTMAVAVGFFENIFFRGWVQLRFEECFGIIPGIVLSAIVYSLYHVGYGMPLPEMITLFIIGLVYSTIFRMTGSIFILFPLLTPMGGLFANINDGLHLPFEATYGFVLVIGLIIAGLLAINRYQMVKSTKETIMTHIP